MLHIGGPTNLERSTGLQQNCFHLPDVTGAKLEITQVCRPLEQSRGGEEGKTKIGQIRYFCSSTVSFNLSPLVYFFGPGRMK